jgi:hypothetical protein
MPDRLMLNTVGIKSPLDVRSRRRASEPAGTASSMHARRALNPRPVISPTRPAPGGAPKLTAVALDEDLAQRLDRTARAAGVSANGLAVAALDAALADQPKALRITDRRRPPTHRATQRTLRLPPHLRHRADRLSGGGASSAATRSELINTAIRRGLPDSPRLALALVIVAATAATTEP